MKKNTLIVCDPDICYAEKLTDYLNEYSGGMISAEVFTDPERLITWLKDACADILLISSVFLSEEYIKELAQVFTGTCIVLSEENEAVIPADHGGAVTASVDKYQSGEAILSSLQEYCHVSRPEKKAAAPVRKKLHVVAVFSPAGRCGKTSFSIGLGEILSETGRSTLYINAEEYSGFSDLFGQSAVGDLSDVIFSIRKSASDRRTERDDPAQMIKARTAVFQTLRYIPPARTPVDVREIRIAEWEKLIELTDGTGEYEYLILDLGTHQNDLFELLELCDFICVPMPEDAVSAAKLHQFRECLHLLDHEALEGRMCVLYLPEIDENRFESFPEHLTGGKMGSYIRKLLRSPQWTGRQETGPQAERRGRYPDVLREKDWRRDENM